jgi:hypothetical protein
MRVFIDCEFTNFIDCELISIGLVADDGREFYGERLDFDKAYCSDFARKTVLPQLGRSPDHVFSRDRLQTALSAWLALFAGEAENTFCVDYAGDWDLLIELLGDVPAGWKGLHIGALIITRRRRAGEPFFDRRG